MPLKKGEPTFLSEVAKKQVPAVVENTRLGSFAFMATAGLSFVTISAVRLLLTSFGKILYEMISFDVMTQWEIQWNNLSAQLKELLIPFEQDIRTALRKSFLNVQNHPITILPKISLFAALFGLTFLPSLGRFKASSVLPSNVATTSDINVDGTTLLGEYSNSDIISNMGTSSSTRLFVQNHDGVIDNILGRSKNMHLTSSSLKDSRQMAPNTSVLRKLGYSLSYSGLILLPFVSHILLTSSEAFGNSVASWDQYISIGLLLLYTQSI